MKALRRFWVPYKYWVNCWDWWPEKSSILLQPSLRICGPLWSTWAVAFVYSQNCAFRISSQTQKFGAFSLIVYVRDNDLLEWARLQLKPGWVQHCSFTVQSREINGEIVIGLLLLLFFCVWVHCRIAMQWVNYRARNEHFYSKTDLTTRQLV